MRVFWVDDAQTILQLDLTPLEKWETYHNAISEARQMALQVKHPVVFIHNAGDVAMPAGNKLAHIERAIKSYPPNIIAGASVITNGFARRIIQVAFMIYGSQIPYEIATTVDDAHAYAQSRLN